MESTLSLRNNPLTDERSKVIETAYSRDAWKVVQCVETGMVFLDNPPSYDTLEEDFAWEKTYHDEKRLRVKREPVLSAVSDFSKKLRHRFRKLTRVEKAIVRMLESDLERYRANGPVRILDVGCGAGEQVVKVAGLLKERSGIVVEPFGVEISKHLADVSNRCMEPLGGRCVQAAASVGIGQLDVDSIDLVILSSYLEHEVEPLTVLRAIRHVLKPGGFVVIRVPNFNCWNRKIRQQKWCGFRYPDHVNYFTPQTLTRILNAAGLEVFESRLSDRLPTNDNVSLVARKPRS